MKHPFARSVRRSVIRSLTRPVANSETTSVANSVASSVVNHLILFAAALMFCLPPSSAFAVDITEDIPVLDDADSADEADTGDVEDSTGVEDADDVSEDEIINSDEISDESPSPIGDALPGLELSTETLYDFLLAEIAGARGQLKLSAQTFMELARKTRDPRIARRAAFVASKMQDVQLIEETSRLWSELAPQSKEARQFAEYIARGHTPSFDKAQDILARALAQNPDKLPANLMGLNSALSRATDKNQARTVIYRLTEPYLKHSEAHFARAQAALLAKRPMEAITPIDRALELRPDWLPAVLLKAHLLTEAGAALQASQMLEETLKRQPDNREIRLAYARSLIIARQYPAARAEFSALLKTAPDDANLLYTVGMLSAELGDASAEELLKKALDSGHPQADIIRLQLGKLAEKRGEHTAARQWFDAVSSGEHAVEARILSARSLTKEGHIKQALQRLRTDRTPENQHRFLLAESSLLMEAGRAKDAFAVVDKALRASPDDNDLLYESAMIADRLGKHAVMETRLRKLIALAPDHAHAYNALGFSLADRGERLKEAEELIAHALELLPGDPFILDSMGWVRFRRGDFNGALARLEEAYALRTDPEIAAHLGEVLWRLNRADESRRILDNALAAHPDNAPLQKTVRRLYKSGKSH